MLDPISDMLTRIRNAQAINKHFVLVPASKIKIAIAQVLKDEGYISDFEISEKTQIPKVGKAGAKSKSSKKTLFPQIKIFLKYYAGRPVIEVIERISTSGLRKYSNFEKLPRPMNGLGIAIISTSQGVVSDRKARELKIGGEILCSVY